MFRPTYKDVPNDQSVAVVIISHNYGHFINDCIQSLINQTVKPFEVIVIADACHSDDTTVSIAESYGIRTLVVDNRNAHLNKKLGLEYVRTPYIIFLDADDYLHPKYIEKCVGVLNENQQVGIVTTELDRGDYIQYHPPCNINQRNWIHAGSMVRRTCLIGCEALDIHISHASHHDWFLWRAIVNQGWECHLIREPLYFYREHAASMIKSVITLPYYDYANLAFEKITVVIPICRDRYWTRLYTWLQHNTIDFDTLCIIDSTTHSSNIIKNDIAQLGKNITYIRREPNNNLADIDRQSNKLAYLDVQETMLKIYSPLRTLHGEYLFIIEDDVLPPNGAITTLLREISDKVAGVSGIVRSRFCVNKRVIAGLSFTDEGEILTPPIGRKTMPVSYTGFGCLLLRKSAILDVKPFVVGNFDMEFCKDLQKKNWKWLLHWGVDCIHGDN